AAHPLNHDSGAFLEFDLAGGVAGAGLRQPGIRLDALAQRGSGFERATMRTGVDSVDLERFQALRQTRRLLTPQAAQRWIRTLPELVVDVGVPHEPDLGDPLDANQVRPLERTHRADDVVSTCQARAGRSD